MCDNLGFVYANKAGHSKDLHIYTIAKALNDVCLGLGARMKVYHTGRRTSVGDKVVDHLSKHEMEAAANLIPGMSDVSDKLPEAVGEWIRRPLPKQDLGRKVLEELQGRFPVKLGRDYRQDLEDLVLSGRLEEV